MKPIIIEMQYRELVPGQFLWDVPATFTPQLSENQRAVFLDYLAAFLGGINDAIGQPMGRDAS